MTSDETNDQVRGEDDHDLLTFDEGGIRLRQAIAETEQALAASPSPETRRLLEPRLAGLLDAQQRASRAASAGPGEEGFLQYRPAPRQQRRGRSIAMSPAELDEFLATERTCRMATIGANGQPHVAPVWFVWDGRSLWLTSLVRSQRWTDVVRDARVAVVVDAGVDFTELRGAELSGVIETVGDVPRQGTPDPTLAEPELLFARKYSGRDEFTDDGRHGWLRLTPDKIVSWDFRKVPPRAK